MQSSVITALDVDREGLEGRVLAILEKQSADASFLISSLIQHLVEKQDKVILVLFHHTLGHYHSICLKFGCNLFSLEEKGSLYVIDVPKCIVNSINKGDPSCVELKDIYLQIKGQVHDTVKCCIILENMSNLLSLEMSLKNVLFFQQYIRGLVYQNNIHSVIISCHLITSMPNSVSLVNSLKYCSDVVVEVSDLSTGKAADVTGSFIVKKQKSQNTSWNTQNEFLFQLLEKNILVFAPGARDALY